MNVPLCWDHTEMMAICRKKSASLTWLAGTKSLKEIIKMSQWPYDPNYQGKKEKEKAMRPTRFKICIKHRLVFKNQAKAFCCSLEFLCYITWKRCFLHRLFLNSAKCLFLVGVETTMVKCHFLYSLQFLSWLCSCKGAVWLSPCRRIECESLPCGRVLSCGVASFRFC